MCILAKNISLNIVKHIPNILTLGNLFCGSVATIFAVQSNFKYAALFVILGIFFDFFDGFAARIFNVNGELGKQLDSLADMITSGLVPGIVMVKLLEGANVYSKNELNFVPNSIISFSNYIGILLTLGACYRLAKFNLDTRQTDYFIGLPTPAMSLFIISLPLIIENSAIEVIKYLLSNQIFLIVLTVVITYLMNVELRLFSLKFKDYNFKNNKTKYIFLSISLFFVIGLKFLAVPLIITLYVLLSLFQSIKKRIL